MRTANHGFRTADFYPSKTSAWPLSLAYLALLVYASWFPFSEWRAAPQMLGSFLWSPWPKYWTRFDAVSNFLGYIPLGFLWGLSALRMGRGRTGLAWACLAVCVLPFLMEAGQQFLPQRIPSNMDFVLNALGGCFGVLCAWLLERMGMLTRWETFRRQWLGADVRGALVLLALWPVALLFPTTLVFGVGQVFYRINHAAESLRSLVPGMAAFWPEPDVLTAMAVGQALSPSAEAYCVFVGSLLPIFLGLGIMKTAAKRMWLVCVVWLLNFWVLSLSSALTYGPQNIWLWLDAKVAVVLSVAVLVSFGACFWDRRVLWVAVLLFLPAMLVLLNQAPPSSSFTQVLETWERGRFVRFHGLAQWIGWLWPYALIIWVVRALLRDHRSRDH